jgi:hypothetical protein
MWRWRRPATSAERSRNTVAASEDQLFLVAESPGDEAELFTLHGPERNLSAVLDIGGARPALEAVGMGFAAQDAYFDLFNPLDSLGTALGPHHRPSEDRYRSIMRALNSGANLLGLLTISSFLGPIRPRLRASRKAWEPHLKPPRRNSEGWAAGGRSASMIAFHETLLAPG